jgi:cob(I)alamin adenosyltransferase
MSSASDSDRHREMTEKRQAAYVKKQAKATKEKGLLIVITGTGKGKTTSALGMGLRALGHQMKLGVVQFLKGSIDAAERRLFEQFDNVDWFNIGDGYTWSTQNREQDLATAQRAWRQATSLIRDKRYDMVILDELNMILKYRYLAIDEVLDTVTARPPMQHIIITGRHAPHALIEAADLVSQIRVIKHPFRDQGIKAQKGIEF